MDTTSATSRALRLLELLQARRFWPGEELAQRLEVTGRTLRRDVERLRELGYCVQARRGRDGGYGLATGGELPPLVFTPEEAAAIAAALSSAAASGAAGTRHLALVALAKLEQVMPSALRRRVRAIRSSVSLGAVSTEPEIDTELLAVLALACRDHERLRIRYTGSSATATPRLRRIDPVRLVPRGARWYLLCWDTERADWRTLRVDRIVAAEPTGLGGSAPAVPGGDAAAFVGERLAAVRPEVTATIRIHAPLAEVEGRLGRHARHFTASTTADGALATDWWIADVRVEVLAAALIWLTWPFEVLDSPELSALLRDRADRFLAATR
ncbi:helix-turn-helix transcriptional regulator [Microbacterium sp.]|uniref:helix-turn-helix transcriptional regulator n=1 Tax=Microbacterium sp. TaxID=51671 RepID=UPI0039E40102